MVFILVTGGTGKWWSLLAFLVNRLSSSCLDTVIYKVVASAKPGFLHCLPEMEMFCILSLDRKLRGDGEC